MAGKLRRADSETPEDILLIRAMRDSNVPKFLSDDLPLFSGIITDLFPGVVVPHIDYGKLEVEIKNQLRMNKLQDDKKDYITKIIQLLQTMTVRHGNMIVGTTGTGKTTLSNTLAAALTALHKAGEVDYWY
jgi:dynein heavy chain